MELVTHGGSMNKVIFKWEDAEAYVRQVVLRYKDVQLSGVYGLPRGGVVLAVMISHALNIPMLMAPVPGCLIVDDICDTGESLVHYAKNSSAIDKPKYHITTMIYKENPIVTPEYYWGKKDNDWIVFPWEE